MRRKILDVDSIYSARINISDKPGYVRTLAIIFAHSGDSWFWLLGLSILWWLGSDYWRSWATILILSIFITAVFVLIIKFIVRRRRPTSQWGDIYRKTDPHSFPSGHAARAMMLAVIAIGLGPIWIGILLLIWAPLVIIARVAMGVHYLSDVIAGGVLGGFIGFLVLNFHPLFPILA